MATRQTFFKSLFANGGIVASMENLQDYYYHFGFTDNGKIVAQCTQDNDALYARAWYPRMRSAAASRISVNITVRTSRQSPTEQDDTELNNLYGC